MGRNEFPLQEDHDLPRDEQGRIIRMPSFKFDPWKGVWQKSIPKLGKNEVLRDDGFVPPIPSMEAIKQMKRFRVNRTAADLYGAIPGSPIPAVLLQRLMDIEGQRPLAPSYQSDTSSESPFTYLGRMLSRPEGV
jgi:hypothetical protein